MMKLTLALYPLGGFHCNQSEQPEDGGIYRKLDGSNSSFHR